MINERNVNIVPRTVLDDKTHSTMQSINIIAAASATNAKSSVVSVKQNDPYGAKVIPMDPAFTMEERYQRQTLLRGGATTSALSPNALRSSPTQPSGPFTPSNYHNTQTQHLMYSQPPAFPSPICAATSPYPNRHYDYAQTVHTPTPFQGFLSDRQSSSHNGNTPSSTKSTSRPSPLAAPSSVSAASPASATSATVESPSQQQFTKFYANGRPMVALVQSEPQMRSAIVTVQTRVSSDEFHLANASDIFANTSSTGMLHKYVIVEGDRGKDLGQIVAIRPLEAADRVPTTCKKVMAAATEAEVVYSLNGLVEEEHHAKEFCQREADRILTGRGLIVLGTFFQFDKEKLTIVYKSPERCYFVALLKALNQQYRCRIWMERFMEESTVPATSSDEQPAKTKV